MNGIVSGKTVDELSAYGKISEKEWNMPFPSSDWNVTSDMIYASQNYLWIPIEIISLTTDTPSFGGTFFIGDFYVEGTRHYPDKYTLEFMLGQVGAHTTGNVLLRYKVLELDTSIIRLTSGGRDENAYMGLFNQRIYATYTP